MPEKPENLALSISQPGGRVPTVPEPIIAHPQYVNVSSEPEELVVPLSHYLWILKRHKWKLLAFVLTAVIATVIVSSRLTPIYQSTATLDIDRDSPANVVGTGSNIQARVTNYDTDQFMATQIRLIQSDSVLRPVAQRFKLRPDSSVGSSQPDPQVPTTRVEQAPVGIAGLQVTRPQNTYLLLISYRSEDPQLAADVANEIADSYIQHSWAIRYQATAGLSTFMEKQLEQLKAKMEASSEKLAIFEKELNVIDPEAKTSILSARLMQLNTELTNAQADRVKKEAAFRSVQDGSLEAAQASSQGDQLRRLADNLRDAQQKFAAIRSQYLPNHPEYKKAASLVSELQRQFDVLRGGIGQRVGLEYREALDRESMIKTAVDDTKLEFDKLNARSYEYKAVKQEADTDKGLYQELWRKIKEAGINASFQNSSIRKADSARPALRPVYPSVRLNAMLALIFASMLGIGSAIAADLLDNTVRDPEQIQRGLKTEVLGSLPVVKSWRGRLNILAGRGSSGVMIAKHGGQISSFEEAVRTLRDSILLSNLTSRPRTLLVTSATPREGKTTTSVHLAIAHSLQKRKTLLIDADLRRPGIHGRLNLSNVRGLSAVVNDGDDWHTLIQTPEAFPDLDVLVAGEASRRGADRLGFVLKTLLAQAEQEYDLVMVDSPPLLGFAEPLQMAAIVDGVVVVVLAGQTSRNAVGSVISSLRRLKANIIGVALNEVRADMSDRYYYYGYYGKYYSKYYKPTNS